MLKGRPRIWILFVLVCVAAHLAIHVVFPPAYSYIKEQYAIAQAEKEAERLEQERLEQEAATAPTDETVEGTEGIDDEKQQVNEVMSSIISILGNAASYLGIMIVIFGIFRLILSFKDDDSEGVSSAIPMVVIGAAMIGFKSIITMITKSDGE